MHLLFELLLLVLVSILPSTHGLVPSWPPKWDESLESEFNWSSIEPQWKLRYTLCYDDLECAKYLVPLDWTHLGLEGWKNVSLAVARLPARVSQSDPKFGGTIVLNPGGPSGSGVDFLRVFGPGIQAIVDGEKFFEILSFDPRGTGYSSLPAACFESDSHRLAWMTQDNDLGSLDDGKLSLNNKWALSQGFSRLCDQTKLGLFPDGTNVRQYVSTAQVAYDMVKLTDAIDEELRYSLASHPITAHSQQILSRPWVLPVLNYWGFSYGTYLGNTFASMFEGRVGRMILDGVVDAPDYTATGWTSNLQDNDKVWDFFFTWCFEAGPVCALYDNYFQSKSDIQAKVELFADYLADNPIPVVANDRILLISHFSLQALMHFAAYIPYQVWPTLATVLQQLMEGSTEAFVSLRSRRSSPRFPFFPSLFHNDLLHPLSNNTSPNSLSYDHSIEAQVAILCGDGEDITSDTKEDFVEYIGTLKNQSTLIGPLWAHITLLCRHWPASQRQAARNRFTGPFASNLSEYQTDGRASPLLFIGNTADPVTPLRNAFKMAREHEGASVLVQNAPGHCSGVTIPSMCTWMAIRKFFNTGKLPENGTVCEVDFKPWDGLEGDVMS